MSSNPQNQRSNGSGGIAVRRLPTRTPHDTEIEREDVFDVLSNARRRYAIELLNQYDPGDEIDLSDLVEYVAARENDTTVADVDYKQRKRVYSSLRQTHLQKLDDCGLIEYDRSRGTIKLDDAVTEVQMHLEYVPEDDIPWCFHYLGLTVVLGGIVALAGLGLHPFTELSTVAFGTIVTAVFGLSAVVHTIHTRRNEIGSNVQLGEH
ncbi:DUF7344 domain-containing protein [Halorubrum sp. DTA46]|uniref:DUF7344 domain-containing protein n=1 Tax=Halorubrum sp. DTA46 TaxID=3402162 RepID=UPI003AAE33E2